MASIVNVFQDETRLISEGAKFRIAPIAQGSNTKAYDPANVSEIVLQIHHYTHCRADILSSDALRRDEIVRDDENGDMDTLAVQAYLRNYKDVLCKPYGVVFSQDSMSAAEILFTQLEDQIGTPQDQADFIDSKFSTQKTNEELQAEIVTLHKRQQWLILFCLDTLNRLSKSQDDTYPDISNASQ